VSVHERLIERQSTDELARKQAKARQRGIWTQEDIDLARRRAEELMEILRWVSDE